MPENRNSSARPSLRRAATEKLRAWSNRASVPQQTITREKPTTRHPLAELQPNVPSTIENLHPAINNTISLQDAQASREIRLRGMNGNYGPQFIMPAVTMKDSDQNLGPAMTVQAADHAQTRRRLPRKPVSIADQFSPDPIRPASGPLRVVNGPTYGTIKRKPVGGNADSQPTTNPHIEQWLQDVQAAENDILQTVSRPTVPRAATSPISAADSSPNKIWKKMNEASGGIIEYFEKNPADTTSSADPSPNKIWRKMSDATGGVIEALPKNPMGDRPN